MEKICPSCNGTGQISWFKGVSRFLLSQEECPACAGLGFLLDPDGEGGPAEAPGPSRPPGSDPDP